ncbi:MAG: RNA 3'-terminal phosphate cyclase [Calditrichia bacterium]
MIVIDGKTGEGGGQILRSALTLALLTAKPFRIENIRAGRKKPGLLRQHLTAVQAATEIGQAEVVGARLGSSQLSFSPGMIRAGSYHFNIGSAGSATLVFQTIFLPLATASAPSHLILEGGTHNPFAPPFDFLQKAFLPLLNRMGIRVEVTLERAGFYPAGGGRFSAHIHPITKLAPLHLLQRGQILKMRAKAVVSRLPVHIAERELKVISSELGITGEDLQIEEITDSPGPGNVVAVEIESEQVTEVFTAFGERGIPAEKVALQAVHAAQRYIRADVPVGDHLADQLLLPCAIAGEGSYRTLNLTRHTHTNLEILKQFIEADIAVEQLDEDLVEVRIFLPKKFLKQG